jgi:hypothetical protein
MPLERLLENLLDITRKLLSSSRASSREPLPSLLSSSSYNTVVCSTQLHLTHCAACRVRDHRPLTSTMSKDKNASSTKPANELPQLILSTAQDVRTIALTYSTTKACC